ncbi:uncharacterized protein LOC101155639 [Tachysurus ichikawai]
MAPVKRHAYKAQFKLQAISYMVVNGNRSAAKEFNINESMVRKWRKQENELRQVKKTKKSFRGNKASYATICEWIVDAWAKVSALTVVRAFVNAGIIAEQPPGNETDYDNDEREPGMFDGEIAQLFNSDTEDEDFDGFVGEDLKIKKKIKK